MQVVEVATKFMLVLSVMLGSIVSNVCISIKKIKKIKKTIIATFSLNLLLLSSFPIAVSLLLFPYFYLICHFCLLVGSFLNFPFSDVFQSEMCCDFFAAFPDHLQPLVISVQETVLASNSRKRKTPLVLIRLFVQPRSQAVFSLAWGRGGKSQEKTFGTRLPFVAWNTRNFKLEYLIERKAPRFYDEPTASDLR